VGPGVKVVFAKNDGAVFEKSGSDGGVIWGNIVFKNFGGGGCFETFGENVVLES